MALSKTTKLAQAKRQLRRIEEDEASFRRRIAALSATGQEAALRWFHGVVEEHRAYVKQLEADVKSG